MHINCIASWTFELSWWIHWSASHSNPGRAKAEARAWTATALGP